jgi:hypothetical protein
MALPILTTADDVRNVVNYFKTKATGATLAEAKAALSKQLFDPRKVSAYQVWQVLTRDGDKFKLTPRAWELGRRPETEQAVFRQILDSVVPYRSALEWAYHQGFDSVNTVDVAAQWHEHHSASLDEDVKDKTIRDNAIAFFHLCEAAGLGKLTVGRGGNPTRLVLDRQALTSYVEAGPSTPPTVSGNGAGESEHEEVDVTGEQEAHEGNGHVPEEVVPPPAAPPEPLRVFIAHGDNMALVEQVETMLALADIKSEIAEAEETPAIPVPDKVRDAMRRAQAGIIVVGAEEKSKNEAGEYIVNENVLIEIGAAFVLYDRKVILMWDKRLRVPSNLQGLYRCEFEGDELTWSAGMKLMKAIQQFKQ